MLTNVVECWKSGSPNVVKCEPKMLWNVNTNVGKCHRMLTNVAKC